MKDDEFYDAVDASLDILHEKIEEDDVILSVTYSIDLCLSYS